MEFASVFMVQHSRTTVFNSGWVENDARQIIVRFWIFEGGGW